MSESFCHKEQEGKQIEMEDEVPDERWERVVEVGELPPGEKLKFECKGIDIAVFNAEGEFYAIGDTCTHAEASLCDGDFYEDIRGWAAECPLHGSTFDVTTGEATALPATGNSGKYAVKVEDGWVYVNPVPVIPRFE